ncbi:MAG TPA: hypothetical protein VN688_26325 [Gemmataceae bacterium]|nr:hypothetical protein [Gemmataceae bacterium]
MASTRKSPRRKNTQKTEPIPPGATQAASDHDLRPGEPAERTPAGEEAVGTPGGGTEVGGLAGTNIDDGDPENANLDKAMGSDARGEDSEDGGPPYAGHSGGATGGAIAQGRSSGGHQDHGIAPGGTPHGDSTIGREPTPRKKHKT